MRVRATALFFAAISLNACDEEDLPSGLRPTGPTGRVRFVNAAPDPTRADRVNVRLENLPFAVNMAYAGAVPPPPTGPLVTPYFPVLTGSRQLAVRRTADTSVKVLDATLTIVEGTDYTVLATGTGTGISALVLTDDNSAPTTGNVKIRVVQASPTAGSVDIYVTAPTVDIATLAPTAANIAFRSATGYFSLPAGAYRVRVTTAGTKTVVVDVTTPALASGAIRTVLTLDRAAGGAPLTSTILTDR